MAAAGQGTPKQPYLIRRRDSEPIGFAGLWESWQDRTTGEVVETCTIITCEPNELMAELHDRMPVILDPADYGRWLDPSVRSGEELLRPCPAEWLEAVPVSTRVNAPPTMTRASSSPRASRSMRNLRCCSARAAACYGG
jgi:putative SOS response-associated peptidase YedK